MERCESGLIDSLGKTACGKPYRGSESLSLRHRIFMSKVFKNIFILVLLGGAVFFYRVPLQNLWGQLRNRYLPCTEPIAYSLGAFDKRFGISKDYFLSVMTDAEAVWEKPFGKDLFKYSSDGALKVNLVYDIRQESTQKLKSMGLVVDNSKASYDTMKSRYLVLSAEYDRDKIILEQKIKDLEIRKSAYDAEVTKINRRGGGDEATVNRLNAEAHSIEDEIGLINQIQDNLNSKADNINALVIGLNQLATLLNIDIKKFNTVGANLSGEFDEGVYKSSADGTEIDIYQFDNRAKLVRVLAHELGHALGLDHVDDPKAIMYRLNNGVNEKLTATDLKQLKNLCGIK